MKYFILTFFILFSLINNTIAFAKEPVSAYFYLHRADSIASLLLTDPKLIIIRSDSVDTTGRSKYWNYYYQKLLIFITRDSIACDTSLIWPTGSSNININCCITSDSAIHIAEINGGRQFRDSNSYYYQIIANLGHDSAQPWEEWDVTYRSKIIKNKELVFVINARTGEIFSKYTLGVSRSGTPKNYALMQNYPNPFNSFTTFEYSTLKPTFLKLTIYDIRAHPIYVLANSYHIPGTYKISWHINDISSGIYFYRLESNDGYLTKTLQLIK